MSGFLALVTYIAFPILLARILASPFAWLPRIAHQLIIAGLTIGFWACLLGLIR